MDEYLTLAHAAGADGIEGEPRFVLPPGPERPAQVDRVLEAAGVTSARPLVGLHLGAAGGTAKLWPAERYAALGGALFQARLTPVLHGGPPDVERAALVSLVLVAVIFICGYHEIRRPILATLCLLVGIAYTLGFATLAVGRLNILSITLVPTVQGVQGHIAYPHLADNPVHRLARMMAALIEKPLDSGNEFFEASSLQFYTADVGNPTNNLIPAAAKASFNIRFNNIHTSRSLERDVRAKLDAIGGNYTLEISVSGEAFFTEPGPLSALVAGAINEVTGRQPELSTTGGTSDARFIRNYCPVVEFGLIGQTMHKVDERAAMADIAQLQEVYRLVLERFFARATA